MKRKAVLLLALFAMAAPLSSAYAGAGFGPGTYSGAAGDPALMLEYMADHLDLTDEQRDSVENILQAAKPEMEALREQATANREAIQSLDPADPAYDTALNNIALSNGELATTGTLLMARVRTQVHTVLTEEQIAKLERGKERMKKRFLHRFDQD